MGGKTKTAFLVLPDSVTHDKATECLNKCEKRGYKVFCLLTSTQDGPIHQIECMRIVDKKDIVILYNSLQDINFTHKIDIIRNTSYLKNNRISVETLEDGQVDVKKLIVSLGPSEKMYLKEAPKSVSVLLYDDGSHSEIENWCENELKRIREYCKSKSYEIADEFVFSELNREKSEIAKFSLVESIATDDIDCIVTLDRCGFFSVIDNSFRRILLDYHCEVEYLDEIDRCSTLLREGSESVGDSNMTIRIINSAFTLKKKAIVVTKIDKVDAAISNELLQNSTNQIRRVLDEQDIKVESFVVVDSDGLTTNDVNRILRTVSNCYIDYVYVCQLPSISVKREFSAKDILSIIDVESTAGEKQKYDIIISEISDILSAWSFWTPQLAESIAASNYTAGNTIVMDIPEGLFEIPELKLIVEFCKNNSNDIMYSVYAECGFASDVRYLIYKGIESSKNIRCFINEHLIGLVANNKEIANQLKNFEDYIRFIKE